MDLGERNPNPLLLTSTVSVQKSQHIKDYLLCGDCEQLFSRKGEKWVIRNAFNGSEFRLQDRTIKSEPISPASDPRLVAYAGAEIEGVDMDKLVYFGLSLFWRASVHRWRLLDAAIHAPLGSHEEVLRRYLLRGQPLSDDIAIHVYVSPHQRPWRTFLTIGPQAEDGLNTVMIFLAGITYQLNVGKLLPVDLKWCSYHSSRKRIFTSTTMDDANAYATIHTYLKQSGHDEEWSAHLLV
jgi:hypothetical protein